MEKNRLSHVSLTKSRRKFRSFFTIIGFIRSRYLLFIILPCLVSKFCLSKSSCSVKPARHVGRCVTQQEPRPRCRKLDPSNSEPNTQRRHYRIQAQAETPALGLDIWFVSPSEKLSRTVREEEKMKDLTNHLDMIIIMFCSNY